MKRKCKNINICDVNTIYPYVADCCSRHKKRNDFKRLFIEHGITNSEYKSMIAGNVEIFDKAITNICIDAVERIKNKNLNLEPVTIKERLDKTTNKVRMIGRESAMQQVFDYIAVYCAMPIFEARMVREQCSSIKGRGQIYGKNIIKHWIKSDCDSVRYAKKHGVTYARKHKYFCKLDIQKCYPSANTDIFLKLFNKDCGNKDLFWLWETLIATHKVDGYTGFMIGALPSQWASQYMVSFIYRHAKSLHYKRRNNLIKYVEGMIMFMDDILITGKNRQKLKEAVKSIIEYTKNVLDWTIKSNYDIRNIDNFSIDMMGYVIHRNAKVSIRARNFIKFRRMLLRNKIKVTYRRSKRLLSYKGFMINSNSRKMFNKYDVGYICKISQNKISQHDRRIAHGNY